MSENKTALWQDLDDYPDDLLLSDQLFDALREATFDGVGISRAAFSPKETEAMQIVEKEAKSLGLKTEWDICQNLIITLEGRSKELPPVIIGSHLDSVPQGGNFDGAAGVLAGLAILAGFKREGFQPRQSIQVYGLRGEESSRFGKAYMGSSALLGCLSAADLALKDAEGITMKEAMKQTGLPVERIERQEKILNPESVAAWIELHIEQGPILIARNEPAGVVSGIRGNMRHKKIECIGEAAHSGAAPKELRHDAVFAAADLLMRSDKLWDDYLAKGKDLVFTSGMFGTDPKEHAIARVPGFVSFSFDARSQDWETLESFYKDFHTLCAAVEKERGVSFKFDNRIDTAPAKLDPSWIEALQKAAEKCGISGNLVPSGAGHDAAVFANAGVPSAMVFVRNENGSHNPHEAMETDDFLAGIALIREAVRQIIA